MCMRVERRLYMWEGCVRTHMHVGGGLHVWEGCACGHVGKKDCVHTDVWGEGYACVVKVCVPVYACGGGGGRVVGMHG